MDKNQLIGTTMAEMTEIVKKLGLPAFNVKQILKWVYQKRVFDPQLMTDLSKEARNLLSGEFQAGTEVPVKVTVSADGTKKYLFPALKNQFIESAYIPDKERSTLCVSTQAGCKMGCLFCMTARQGFQGHLSAREIINQVMSIPESESLTNIVFMGMGEPFDNLESVLKSLEVLTADWGLGFNPKKITVSTIGIIPGMERFLKESRCHLAVSLHSPFHEERRNLMPVENIYPLPDLIKVIREFDFGHQRRISFEYILFDGVNDTEKHIKELSRLLNGIRCRINLIRYHSIPGSSLKPSPYAHAVWFRDQLTAKGFTATIRASRGEDILAACGLLSTKELIGAGEALE